MPRALPIELGPRTFPTRTVAKTYMRVQILNGYEVGDEITNPEHIQILEDLLSRKSNAAEKVGDGISYWFVDLTNEYGRYVSSDARTVAIMRTDGSKVDFGYTKLIDESEQIDFVQDALRHAVQDKRDAFKFSHFGSGTTIWDDRGAEIETHDLAEVRYSDPTWGRLTRDFADSVGGWDAIETSSGAGEGQVGRRLVSDEIRNTWRDWYEQHAYPYLRRKAGTAD